MTKQFYLVTIDRRTRYRVQAESREHAKQLYTPADKIDQVSKVVRAELDTDQDTPPERLNKAVRQ